MKQMNVEATKCGFESLLSLPKTPSKGMAGMKTAVQDSQMVAVAR